MNETMPGKAKAISDNSDSYYADVATKESKGDSDGVQANIALFDQFVNYMRDAEKVESTCHSTNRCHYIQSFKQLDHLLRHFVRVNPAAEVLYEYIHSNAETLIDNDFDVLSYSSDQIDALQTFNSDVAKYLASKHDTTLKTKYTQQIIYTFCNIVLSLVSKRVL
jgi:hypothetical protein